MLSIWIRFTNIKTYLVWTILTPCAKHRYFHTRKRLTGCVFDPCLPVEEYRVHVLVWDRWLLGAGGHFERTQKYSNKRRQLLHILLLTFHHSKHNAVEKGDKIIQKSLLIMGEKEVHRNLSFAITLTFHGYGRKWQVVKSYYRHWIVWY